MLNKKIDQPVSGEILESTLENSFLLFFESLENISSNFKCSKKLPEFIYIFTGSYLENICSITNFW